jgi:uncharacterized membrane protein YeaQ/YmgE (transglycosylase-associated protein family)
VKTFRPTTTGEARSSRRSSLIANLLGTGGIFELNVLGFIVAVVSAVVLLGIFEGGASRRT